MGRWSAQSRRIREQGTKKGLAGLADLGERLFEEALVTCESEREAAAMASAGLLAHLERRRTAPARPAEPSALAP